MNSLNDRNIVLTGFMGTGKSTVGPIVADLLDRTFIEADREIEIAADKTIPKIFAEDGEAAFRQMERELCKKLAEERGLVISTGGGMLVDETNRKLMEQSGFVVCLTASADAIQERLEYPDGRPLAASWWELLERRQPIYDSFPHQVDTTDKSPEVIADAIIRLWKANRIPVNAPGGSYDIVIEAGLLAALGNRAAEFGLSGRVLVVTNDTVAPLYGERLVANLPDAALVTMPDGEQYKTLETVSKLYDDFIEAGADRKTTVIALGGGVVGDTAGFAAATYMRGVRLVQIPTTLLSMVDSSVGGKVGVDLPQGKNLIGAFKQPDVVLIDPDVLKTLPPEQWRCGMAEAIKHGFLADEGLLNPALFQPERAAELVRRAVQVKVDVVEDDPYEMGIRAHLNLGHTFGHAIEQVTGYQWLHGDAVGFGLLAAAKLSHELGLCDAALVERVDTILAEIGLPRRTNGLDSAAIYAAMKTDKKWQHGRSRFVLIEKIGQAKIVEDVEEQKVIRILDELR